MPGLQGQTAAGCRYDSCSGVPRVSGSAAPTVPAGSQAGAESARTPRPLARPDRPLGEGGCEPAVAGLGPPTQSRLVSPVVGGLCAGNGDGERDDSEAATGGQGLGTASPSAAVQLRVLLRSACPDPEKLERPLPEQAR